MRLRKEIGEGAAMPRGYGRAWVNPVMMVAVCYPVPLNWIFGWAREAYLRLVRGPKDRLWAAERLAEQRGYERGRADAEKSQLGQALGELKELRARVCRQNEYISSQWRAQR